MSTQPSQIYQIFYDENSREKLDPGFIALDNTPNERPDWREYWPIRQYLLTQALSKDTYYGFFSPKFFAKTGLDANAVYEFINQQSADTDVILFSPFFDQGSFFLNIFEQGTIAHPGTNLVFEQSIHLVMPQLQISNLVMDSRSIVFCNFIVAKPQFWKKWLEVCERIFLEAESNKTPLANLLNETVLHDTQAACKTFVIERLASLLLVTIPDLKIKNYKSLELPLSHSKIRNELDTLVSMDALKMAYLTTKNPLYIERFREIQKQIIEAMNRQL